MSDLLSKLLIFPPHPPPRTPLTDAQYDEGIKSQINTIGKLSPEKLLAQTPGGENALDVIDPALNTVSYLFILLAHCNSKTTLTVDSLVDKIEYFLSTFDGRQARYLGRELSELVNTLSQIARNSNQPYRAIPGVVNAILRIDPTGSVLTSNHLLLTQLALESRVFQTALPVLDKYILYFPGSTNWSKPKYICQADLSPTAYITAATELTLKLNYQAVLEYFYNTGLIYIGLHRWESALESLEGAVTYPAKDTLSISKYMVEAYKKWILVGVLLQGKALPLPKSTTGAAAKSYHIVAKPYETLAQIFETATAARLKSEFEVGKVIWNNDCNLGLILEVLAAYQKFQIRNLGNIYSKISIPEVLNQTQSAETGTKLPSAQATEQLVESMIADGTLHATMTRSANGPSILAFSPNGPTLTEAQMKVELQASTERIKALTEEIKLTDRMLTHDKEYIKQVQKSKKNKTLGFVPGDSTMEWNAPEEEQLMGDLF